MTIKTKNPQSIAAKFVDKRVLQGGWSVYRDFETEYSDGDVLLYAPRAAPEIPTMRGVQAIHTAWMREDLNRVRVYAPLRDNPDLFLDFAALVRKRVETRDDALWIMLDWIKSYGVLGLDSGDDRAENLTGFWRAAKNAARCLELYEAATVEKGVRGDPDVEILDRYIADGETATEKREWALGEVTRIVGNHVEEWCYPQLYRRVNTEVGRTVGFEQGWGFRSLLGAMYLQMMWLITEGGHPPRCKWEKCNRIVRIGKYAPGDKQMAEESKHKGGRPRRYRTRSDKDYCSDNCKGKAYYHEVVKPRNRQRAGRF